MTKIPPPKTEPARSARLPLNSLRVFEAVALQGSFSAAAEALNVTTAAVSMQIKSLEDYLQIQLLHRNAREVQLTVEGQALLPYVRRGLDEFEHGLRIVKSSRTAGALVVSMLTSYLQKWLLPRLSNFHALYPNIDLQLRSTPELADFARDDVHVAIRHGRGNWPKLHCEKLLSEWLVPVCTPAMFERFGQLNGPGDTGNYPLIHSSSEPWSLWSTNFNRDGLTHVNCQEAWPLSGTAYDDSVTVLQAAERGQGLALARWSLAADDIAAGKLVLAYPHALPFVRGYYFVCPEQYLSLIKITQFRDWLIMESARFPKPSAVID